MVAALLEPKKALSHAEYCGRICWKSEPDGDQLTRKFLAKLVRSGHTSVLEHVGLIVPDEYAGVVWRHAYPVEHGFLVNGRSLLAMAEHSNGRPLLEDREIWEFLDIIESSEFVPQYRPTFEIVCDRAVSHELVRHRVMAFSQESQRYVKYDSGPSTVISRSLDEAIVEEIENAAIQSWNAYKSLRDKGIQPQVARAVLPNSAYTKLVMTGWMWEWEWFLQLRDDKAAHPDIRKIAEQIRDLLEERRNLEWWKSNVDQFGILRQTIPRHVLPLPQ